MMDAALSGMGIAYVPNSLADEHIASGALQLVLDGWSPFFDGYFLYSPTRRQNLAVFRLVVDALRHCWRLIADFRDGVALPCGIPQTGRS